MPRGEDPVTAKFGARLVDLDSLISGEDCCATVRGPGRSTEHTP